MAWGNTRRYAHDVAEAKQYALGTFEQEDFLAWLDKKKESAPVFRLRKVVATLRCHGCEKEYKGNQRRGALPVCRDCRKR